MAATIKNLRTDVFQKFYERWGEKSQQRMFDRLVQQQTLQPGWSLAKIAAFLMAFPVHFISLTLLVGGIYRIFVWGIDFGSLVVGGILVSLGWYLRPRLGSFPDLDDRLERTQHPALYGFVDRVSRELNTTPVDMIAAGIWFNASFGRTGFPPKKVLYLGISLWQELTPEERVALIGHEIAHDVNGDVIQGFWVGGAWHTLRTWYYLLYPDSILSLKGFDYLLTPIFNLVMGALAYLVRFYAYVMIHLLLFETRRAEYLADEIAAKIGGTRAAISLLGKLDRGNLEKTTLDQTHPPIPYRARFLQNRLFTTAAIALSADEVQTIDNELAKTYQRVRREMDKRGWSQSRAKFYKG